ncbi:MAG: mismatch repair protein MutS [Firmicutes bacterium]|nr:mismatch repair protein MutS [Bacillota bacterium]
MQQYLEVKDGCKDCILFFRLGDFYEMFFEDARTASRELELVLTGRDCGLEKRADMCGIPFHAADSYISRLINKGYKVAICEQLEDPSQAKGIVKRGIIKVITPGTFTDSSFLEENRNNFLVSVFREGDVFSLCSADISTGEFNCTEGAYEPTVLLDEISKFSPRELLVQDSIDSKLMGLIRERFDLSITELPPDYFEADRGLLESQFKDADSISLSKPVISCSCSMLKYIMDTQKVSLPHIDDLNLYSIIEYLSIDVNSRRNLELTETLRDKTRKGSLLWVLDRTSTSMGARRLRSWIEQPLVNRKKIEGRLNSIGENIESLSLHYDLIENLKEIYDIERIVGRISSKSVNAKELISLKKSIEKIPAIKGSLSNFKSSLYVSMNSEIDALDDVHKILEDSIMDNPGLSAKEGNIIKEGFSQEVDDLRSAKTRGKEWISALEASERETTGIKSLKIGFNKVFGYYIEITKSNFGQIPEGRYIRKQTLANAERYITPELKEMEDKILGAEEKLLNLEYELFAEVRDEIEKHIYRMKHTAKIISEIDCLCSLAAAALENGYVKPVLNDAGTIDIREGRHPVVEKVIPTGGFVSNDTYLDSRDQQLMLITGPNMAGKSTYMRQVALISIMAQIGSFVPAKSAQLSVCDRVFTRIGASDDLAAGKSTFMVEMWEVSNILHNATPKSLVLLDEVGRGTSTYDGLSIAWAVIEHICTDRKIKCKTLFATHYHELTKLEGTIDGVVNYRVAVREIQNEIIFLHKIVRGGTDQSYGIEVAKLAGLPMAVINRAKEILVNIEAEHIPVVKSPEPLMQLGFADLEKDKLIKELASIDVMNMTPMESMNKLNEFVMNAKSI